MATPNLAMTLLDPAQAQKDVTANAALTDLDQFTGWLQVSVASGDVALSADQSQNGFIDLTGAPGATRTVTQYSTVLKRTWFRNSTTGGQTINVKMFGGTSYAVPAGGLVLLLATGAAVRFHSDTAPLAGATTAAAGTSAELSRVDHRHPRDVVEICFNAATVAWTDQPSALTELFGLNDRRTRYDLTQFTQARLVANVEVVGNAGATLRAEFATTDGGTYAALDNSTGPNVAIDATGTVGSGYVNLTAAAKADVFLRIVGVGGDGVLDPQLGRIAVQFR
jgi:hypothetical protein